MTDAQLLIAVNTVWVVFAAVLVMFMQAGFAFLEAGLTRMKNVGHVAAKNVLIFALASIVYYLVGFGIAFGAIVLDDEDQQRLRKEARLEDASPVLVRDPALAAVPDRLDDGHAHVTRRSLDRFDHGLDPFSRDHRLHLRHV